MTSKNSPAPTPYPKENNNNTGSIKNNIKNTFTQLTSINDRNKSMY